MFDVPLKLSAQAAAASLSPCGVSGMAPYRRIKGISFSGGWNTVGLLGHDIPVGVRALVHFTADTGLDVTGGLGLQCSLIASLSASGMAGPIPVTAGIEGALTAYAGVGGKLSTGGTVHVDAGAETTGAPPALVWQPQLSLSDPNFSLSADRLAEARAGIGLAVKAGIGNDYVASATIKLGSSLDLTAQPGMCSWDATFGQFSAGGRFSAGTSRRRRPPRSTPRTSGAAAREVAVTMAVAGCPVGSQVATAAQAAQARAGRTHRRPGNRDQHQPTRSFQRRIEAAPEGVPPARCGSRALGRSSFSPASG